MRWCTPHADKDDERSGSPTSTGCPATILKKAIRSKRTELIAAVDLPASQFNKHAYYLKIRDRSSYAFALVSVAAALEMDGNTIKRLRAPRDGRGRAQALATCGRLKRTSKEARK